MVAHVVEGLIVLAGARILVYIVAVLGAHVRAALNLREARCVLLVVSRARHFFSHLCVPNLLPLSFGDALAIS